MVCVGVPLTSVQLLPLSVLYWNLVTPAVEVALRAKVTAPLVHVVPEVTLTSTSASCEAWVYWWDLALTMLTVGVLVSTLTLIGAAEAEWTTGVPILVV